MNKKRQILVAGMGTSPAVLTNAVRKMAQLNQEDAKLRRENRAEKP